MEPITFLSGGITSAKGFYAAGVEAGVKYANRRDVALIWSEVPCVAAGVFTTNLVAAAPVVVDRERLAAAPAARAIAVNTGCANACTGEQGLADARAIAAATANVLGVPEQEVLVSSTGVIGTLLPVDRIIAGVAKAKAALARGAEADEAVSRAIMTTDTVPKRAAVQVMIDGKPVTLGGMCKGAGMIEPMMATMLAYVTTDAAVDAAWLQRTLKAAADVSFNRVVVDGDESTNDTLICLANGAAGNAVINEAHPDAAAFAEAILFHYFSLSKGGHLTSLKGRMLRVGGQVRDPGHRAKRTLGHGLHDSKASCQLHRFGRSPVGSQGLDVNLKGSWGCFPGSSVV